MKKIGILQGNRCCYLTKLMIFLKLTTFLFFISFTNITANDLIVKEPGYLLQQTQVSGTVTDGNGDPLPGVTVLLKGTTIGTLTNAYGKYTIAIPPQNATLVFSFIGFKAQELPVTGRIRIDIVLMEEVTALEEVTVVGYGTQKKASVVGAITATTGTALQRTGGITNVAQALTGNLPGVTTIQLTGQPGSDDPTIYIRGRSTWNGGQPYIIVDGVERRMNDLDMSEIENISVLKDASATAVYGVKGANGVILITTKRGVKGKPVLTVSANSTIKSPSLLIKKLNSYDTYNLRNASIEREVVLNEAMWPDYYPTTVLDRWRNQSTLKWPEAYPDVDWQKETFKNFAVDSRFNMNISGGTNFARYFTSLAYTHEGDLVKDMENGEAWKGGFTYDKFNFRTNLDLNLTKTTVLKFNLAGIIASKKQNANVSNYYLNAQHSMPPSAFLPVYADGRYGRNPNTIVRLRNSVAEIANRGYYLNKTTDLTTDLELNQDLNAITKGLSASVRISFDNSFLTNSGVTTIENDFARKYIFPEIEDVPEGGDTSAYILLDPVAGANQFSWLRSPWVLTDETSALSSLKRRLYYSAQVNYLRSFGRHNVSATGVFTREQLATGSEFPRYREDWVFRTTYDYFNRYQAEFNGAYNGSEKFGRGYRFAFFPSAAIGWVISEESFMKEIGWLNRLKVRYSYGFIGDDGGLSDRWLYASQWKYRGTGNGNSVNLGPYGNTNWSPYGIYHQTVVGNPDIHWEKARKTNLGVDVAVFHNMISGNAEYFTEYRTDILLAGSSRVLPPYFGAVPPTANVGRVTKKGYEVELRFNKDLGKWRIWANVAVTHAVDKILEREEPELTDPHRKAAGFQIGQFKSQISQGFLNSWDEVYGSSGLSANNQNKLPGDYNILDYDANGYIDGLDSPPYGYSDRPQNDYSYSFGTDYKGFSLMIQFYAVNNVTRNVQYEQFVDNIEIAYAPALDYWSKDNLDATSHLLRWKSASSGYAQYDLYDGSYVRLKNAELAYTFKSERLKTTGMSSLRLYVNGNNLLFWSKLPDDREAGQERYGFYPNMRRINFGIDVKF